MPTLTYQDVGACNCGNLCHPCSLPFSNLSLAFTTVFSGVSGTTTLVFSQIGNICTWCTGSGPGAECYSPNGVVSFKFAITCNLVTGSTEYRYDEYSDNACATGLATYTYITSGGGSGMNPKSATCSPLNIQFTLTGSSFVILTIT